MIRQIVLATALITLAAAEVSSEAIDSDHCTASDANDCVVSYMEEVVVTASRTSKKLRNSPLSLSLINSEQLLHNTADGIAEILQDLPGISVSDSGQAGLKRIRIRGEESRRIAVLIDGQESTDHREVGVPLLIDPQRSLGDRCRYSTAPRRSAAWSTSSPRKAEMIHCKVTSVVVTTVPTTELTQSCLRLDE